MEDADEHGMCAGMEGEKLRGGTAKGEIDAERVPTDG